MPGHIVSRRLPLHRRFIPGTQPEISARNHIPHHKRHHGGDQRISLQLHQPSPQTSVKTPPTGPTGSRRLPVCLDGFAFSKNNTQKLIEDRLRRISKHFSNCLAMAKKLKKSETASS